MWVGHAINNLVHNHQKLISLVADIVLFFAIEKAACLCENVIFSSSSCSYYEVIVIFMVIWIILAVGDIK